MKATKSKKSSAEQIRMLLLMTTKTFQKPGNIA
jgi:hypothetical protein